MRRIRRIVHPTDFSPGSRAAFARAVEMAKGNRAELVIVHVLSVVVLPILGEAYVSPRVYDEVSTAMHASARKQLDALVRKARKAASALGACCSRASPTSASCARRDPSAPASS